MPARTRGVFISTDAYGTESVVETFTCAHCQHVFPKPKQGEDSGWCHQCFKPVCLSCGASDRCDPFEKKLMRMELRGKLLRSLGLE